MFRALDTEVALRWDIPSHEKKNAHPRKIPIPKNPGDKKSPRNPQSPGYKSPDLKKSRILGDKNPQIKKNP